MINERKFYRCPKCGKIVGVVQDSKSPLICCGAPMEALEPNSTDAAQEKHVPVGTRDGNKLTVTVGAVAHPMTEEHLISWIAVAQGNRTIRVHLTAEDAPEAVFCVDEGPATVYAYCNLHGLWSAEL